MLRWAYLMFTDSNLTTVRTVLSCSALLWSCATTTTRTQTIDGPVRERRTLVEPGAPIGASTWQWDGRGFSGKLEWRLCDIEKVWREKEQRVTATKPNYTLPYVLMLAGGVTSLVGTATYDFSHPGGKCSGAMCKLPEGPDNSRSIALMLGGGAVFVTGSVLRLQRPSTTVEDGKSRDKSARVRSPCIQPRDRDELTLVLQVAQRRFLSIKVNEDWTARVDIPSGVSVPRNTDLAVLIYRVPRHASGLVGQWHVVGYARASDD